MIIYRVTLRDGTQYNFEDDRPHGAIQEQYGPYADVQTLGTTEVENVEANSEESEVIAEIGVRASGEESLSDAGQSTRSERESESEPVRDAGGESED